MLIEYFGSYGRDVGRMCMADGDENHHSRSKPSTRRPKGLKHMMDDTLDEQSTV